jgi:hypothetical protein
MKFDGNNLTQAHYKDCDDFKFYVHYNRTILTARGSLHVLDNCSGNIFAPSNRNGNPVCFWKSHGDINQAWNLSQSNDVDYLNIDSGEARNKSLDNKGSYNEGTGYHIWDSDKGNWNQQFKFEMI